MFGKKDAAMALIFHPDGERVLGVSRKDDHSKMGLPGGKLEGEETFNEAVVRETFEETGLKIVVKDHIFTKIDGDFYGMVLRCEIEGEVPEEFNDVEESGRVAWVTWQELFDGPFGAYNRALYSNYIAFHHKWDKLVVAESEEGLWDFVNIMDDSQDRVKLCRFDENDKALEEIFMTKKEFLDLANLIKRIT